MSARIKQTTSRPQSIGTYLALVCLCSLSNIFLVRELDHIASKQFATAR